MGIDQDVECGVERRRLRCEPCDAACRRMDALAERVEVEPIGRRDHQLAIEHEGRDCKAFERRDDFRKIAVERLARLRLQRNVSGRLEDDAPEAVPFRFELPAGVIRQALRRFRFDRLEAGTYRQGREH